MSGIPLSHSFQHSLQSCHFIFNSAARHKWFTIIIVIINLFIAFFLEIVDFLWIFC